MTVAGHVKTRVGGIAALSNRVEEVADLAELVAKNELPQRFPWAFILPTGFDGGPGELMTGAFRQPRVDGVGVVLFCEATGDAKAQRAMAAIDVLIEAVLAAVCGTAPADAPGVLYAVRGRLVSINAGAIIYQIDFGLQNTLRVGA